MNTASKVSNPCTCTNCVGAACTCGCNTLASDATPKCQCGDACTCVNCTCVAGAKCECVSA